MKIDLILPMLYVVHCKSDSVIFFLQWEKFNNDAKSSLSVDGETCYELAEYPVFLLIAKTILLNCRQKVQTCQVLNRSLVYPEVNTCNSIFSGSIHVCNVINNLLLMSLNLFLHQYNYY